MSGTGGPSPAEQHLGDRLAALVDGELGHDARERVLAHLATCWKCKAEADAQRQVKSVFAETAPPGPSEGLLARLQGLPGGDPDGPGSPLGTGSFGRRDFGAGGGAFGYVPTGAHAMAGVPPQPRSRGFRIHESEQRPAPRRRFAFAAAGAVSLAAIALGGALPLEAAVDSPGPRGDGAGVANSPLRPTPMAGRGPHFGHAGPQGGGAQEYGARGAQEGPVPLSGVVTPAPSAMGLYAPISALPPRGSGAPLLPSGEIRLSPLPGAEGRATTDRMVPVAASSPSAPLRTAGPPLPPPEP